MLYQVAGLLVVPWVAVFSSKRSQPQEGTAQLVTETGLKAMVQSGQHVSMPRKDPRGSDTWNYLPNIIDYWQI